MVARTSSFAFRDSNAGIGEIANEVARTLTDSLLPERDIPHAESRPACANSANGSKTTRTSR